MFKIKNLLLVAAFALATGLGQSAIAESTDAPKVTTPETTITQLHDPATADIATMNEVIETEGEFEIVEGTIIGEALSADQIDNLITKVHGCHKRKCMPVCPRCKIPDGAKVGHCRSGGAWRECKR